MPDASPAPSTRTGSPGTGAPTARRRTSRRRGRDTARRLVIDGRALVDVPFSGIGHYAMHLVQALDGILDEHPERDVRLAIPANRLGAVRDLRLERIRPLRVPFSYLGLRRRQENRKLPPMDVLLGPGTYFFPNYLRWPLRRSPSVTAVHDLSFVKLPETVDGPNARFLTREVADTVRRSDRLTALTRTMADEIAEHYDVDRNRIHVVGCAADTARFYRRSDREVHDVTTSLGIFGRYILSVGNIEPRKNQVRLLDAFCSLPRELTASTMLVLVGAGAWNEEAIHDRVEAAIADGHLVKLLLGCVSDRDLPALYSGAHASAYVSRYEGFGMPPLESMACRTPVLAGNRSVLPEVVGDAAVLADPERTDSIGEGLARLLALDDHERDDLVTRGVANVARYRWDDAARSLLDAVDAAAGVAAGPSDGAVRP